MQMIVYIKYNFFQTMPMLTIQTFAGHFNINEKKIAFESQILFHDKKLLSYKTENRPEKSLTQLSCYCLSKVTIFAKSC